MSSLVFPAFVMYALALSVVGIVRTGAERSGRGLAVAGTIVSGLMTVASTAVVGLLVPFAVLAVVGDNPVADVAGEAGEEILDEARAGPTAPEPDVAAAPDAVPEEQVDPTPRDVTLAEVRVGHCLLEFPPGELVFEVEVVDCRVPHAYEVYGGFPAPVEDPADGLLPAYPGEAEMEALANAACLDLFEALARRRGVDPGRLDVAPLYPTEEGWAESDTYVTCLVYNVSGDDLIGGPLLTPPRPLP